MKFSCKTQEREDVVATFVDPILSEYHSRKL